MTRAVVRSKAPETLLVDHPALPIPQLSRRGVLPLSDGTKVPIESLSQKDRVRAAVQLTALSALLADFDLWPGRWALQRARATTGDAGLQVRVDGFPMRLASVSRRLGGGERGALDLRDAVRRAVISSTGLSIPRSKLEDHEPGFFLGPMLRHLVKRLPLPLDSTTARNLWAARWELPPLPEEAEIRYWSVPRLDLAFRIATALTVAARARGPAFLLTRKDTEDTDTTPLPAARAHGTLVLAGVMVEEDLGAVERWVGEGGRCAVIIGRFPLGWDPPAPPGFDACNLDHHLALCGAPLEVVRNVLRLRTGRFDPLSRSDRLALTSSACQLFCSHESSASSGEPERRAPGPLIRALELLPEGLPEGLLVLCTQLAPDEISRQAIAQGVSRQGDRWRLSEPQPMRRDPLHHEVAGLFPEGDPRRLRHLALADGSCSELETWIRRSLDQLEGDRVRSLLADVAPGELGPMIQAAQAEACLSQLDLAGARRALSGLDEPDRQELELWMRTLDADPEQERSWDDAAGYCHSGRAGAEIILSRYRHAVHSGASDPTELGHALDAATRSLRGPARAWIEIDRVSIDQPDLLLDRSWSGRVTAGHPALNRLLRHRAAMHHTRNGRPDDAQAILAAVAREESSPGRRGMVYLDLAIAEAELGAADTAERHLVKAFRLLQAAGFRHRMRDVLFNLAVSALDRLEVPLARARLRAYGGVDGDSFAAAEEARLALAVGDETAFRDRLGSAPAPDELGNSSLHEGLSLLHGVAAVLDGSLAHGHRLLAAGGDEGRVWLRLVAALGDDDEPRANAQDDPWGITTAARIVRAIIRKRSDPDAALVQIPSPPAPSDALALGIVERTMGRQAWLTSRQRSEAADRLTQAGLDGWARLLRSGSTRPNELVAALAALSDGGRPESLGEAQVNSLLDALGLSGLEVLDGLDGKTIWRCGRGHPEWRRQHGHLILVPLGGDPGDGPEWQLLANLLLLLLPRQCIEPRVDADGTGIFGFSPVIQTLRAELQRYADSRSSVILLGETGVGKDLAARALHRLSGRTGRYLAVNVAAIPDGLLEGELFGSERGAYTGADRRRIGLVDSADGGTLFLDEIGDLGLPLQVKLLRFLESSEVRPLGSDQAHTVDVRIVAATHRNLEERVSNGSFRQDLYYRVSTIAIQIPPLRDRKMDLPILRSLFEDQIVARDGLPRPVWTPDAETALQRHAWPGNVRELRNVVEGALLRAAGQPVTVDDLRIASADAVPLPAGTWDEAMQTFRRRFLIAALDRNSGNRSATARELGISRQALLYHVKNLGLASK